MRNGGGKGGRAPKTIPSISRWGAAQLEIILAQLSTIEAQSIPGRSASEIPMGGPASPQPLIPYLVLGLAQYSTIEPNLTFKFGIGEGWGRHFHKN